MQKIDLTLTPHAGLMKALTEISGKPMREEDFSKISLSNIGNTNAGDINTVLNLTASPDSELYFGTVKREYRRIYLSELTSKNGANDKGEYIIISDDDGLLKDKAKMLAAVNDIFSLNLERRDVYNDEYLVVGNVINLSIISPTILGSGVKFVVVPSIKKTDLASVIPQDIDAFEV